MKTQKRSEENSRSPASTTARNRLFEKLIAVVAALAVWQVAAMLVDQSIILVTPVRVLEKLFILVQTADFWSTVLYSLIRMSLGFFAALIAGVLLAFFASRFRPIEILLWPYMAAVKSTPVASFVILCLLWLGAARLSVFISFLMVLPVIYTNVLQGIKSTDKKLLEMAFVFRMPIRRRLFFIYLPGVKNYFLSAAGVAIGFAWKAGIAAEVIGIPKGSIGERLYEAKIYLNSAELFAWTLVIVVISVVFEKLFLTAVKRVYERMEKV
ncbi:MAG TPA: ABC transporter permease subunit [Clostridiaceae bacterium]|jgi:NitT/TauT family transport system permease protein|nr:ABC transporter permease subunit [Clostridiaceae bacterium]